MPAWVAWVVVAAICGGAEVVTLGLVLGMIAIAAVAAALVAAAGVSVVWQIITFGVATPLLLTVVRPVARRHLHVPAETRTGVAALVGRQAVVLQQVDGHGGQVRLGGEVWSARSYDSSAVIPPGATVDVLSIEGATALVHPIDPIDLTTELSWPR
ncbi:MAG TPA: NfeD family protein [Mycobacteriales bacterium]|jgi:membrane protein implicated in regulation of membrane protease activity|nr:NfeD family protein [Mycobacteriales bacterium]